MNKNFAVTYKTTRKPDHIWIGGDIGFAYEYNGAFIHIQGDSKNPFWMSINNDMVITEKANGNIEDWVTSVFGAANIKQTNHKIGEVVSGVWRPGIYFQNNIHQAFKLQDFEMRSAERALLSLIDRLEDILSYIEPSTQGLQAFGHKNRELLILACTEVENGWKQYRQLIEPKKGNLSTTHYVRLQDHLFLKDYQVKLKAFASTPDFCPFEHWNAREPTESLKWYSAYNAVKHNRQGELHLATLENCIFAVAANIVLFAVRYGPYRFFRDGLGYLFTRIENLLEFSMITPDPTTFYIPKFEFPAGSINSLTRHPGNYCMLPWASNDPE